MLSKYVKKYYWFIALFIVGGIAQIILLQREENISNYPTKKVEIVVKESAYHYKGTVTGKSFVKVIGNDGLSYQMPLEERLFFNKGDRLLLEVPEEYKSTEKELVPVASYMVIEKANILIEPNNAN